MAPVLSVAGDACCPGLSDAATSAPSVPPPKGAAPLKAESAAGHPVRVARERYRNDAAARITPRRLLGVLPPRFGDAGILGVAGHAGASRLGNFVLRFAHFVVRFGAGHGSGTCRPGLGFG